MENRDNQNSGQNTDVSKAAQAQQPQNERAQRPEEGQAQTPSEPGQAGFGENQADTTTEQRTDVEGSSFDQSSGTGSTSTGEASDIEGSSFVGSEGAGDTSSELIEDEDKDFARGDGE